MYNQTSSDATLVGAFCDANDDAARQRAFSALLERHAAMVLGTCRRITGNQADAEDAAQAVFVTLASKAPSLRDHPTVGGWLHRAARNIALRKREATLTRSRYEAQEEAQTMSKPPLDNRLRQELREELDHALDHLSERYRIPLVLHYLDGHSQEEVARILRVKEGTLASLLSRGREMLRTQLGRKGVTVSALSLTVFLSNEACAASAAVPSGFIAATSSAANSIAAASFSTAAAAGTVAPHVLSLATTTSKVTIAGAVKLAAASLAAVATITLAGITLGGFASPSHGAEAPPSPVVPSAETSATAPNADDTPAATPPQTTPATTGVPLSTPDATVRAAVDAVRHNNLANFLRQLDPESQAQWERNWQNAGTMLTNPWIGGLFARFLRASAAADAQSLIEQYVTPILANIDADKMSAQLRDPMQFNEQQRSGLASIALAATLRSILSGTLASGLESEQTAAIAKYLGSIADWLPHAGFTDTDKAKEASALIGKALSKFGTADVRELTSLDLSSILTRASLAMPDLKLALAVYDLHLDRALDSVKITTTGDDHNAVVRLTFTAFGTEHTFPMKMQRVETKTAWSIQGDSPLATWLQPRGGKITINDGNNQRFGMWRGGPPQQRDFNGNRNFQRGRRTDQAPDPAPEPTADPGF